MVFAGVCHCRKVLCLGNEFIYDFLFVADIMVAETFAELSSDSLPCYLGHASQRHYGECTRVYLYSKGTSGAAESEHATPLHSCHSILE